MTVSLALRRDMRIQHCLARTHFAVLVQRWLDGRLYRGGPVHLARSADLSLLDFFFWGAIKVRVYREVPQTVEDLEARISEASAAITNQMLQRISGNMRRRFEVCLLANGSVFTYLL